jgi:WS/DGAT/MGAT family acyltransferase
MAKALGISFNDLLLWLCSTALRHFLVHHDSIPKSSLIAAMPVSLREDQNQELNTQASMTLVQLGTQYADPRKRLQAILSSSTKVRHAMTHLKSVLPTDYPSLLAPWLVGGVARALFKTYRATGLSKRLPMLCNLVISNVPGPQVPLYLAGARMLTFYPLSIVTHGVALNITVQTYAGSVDFGLVADAQAVPPETLQTLAEGLKLAFDEAQGLFGDLPALSSAVPSGAVKSVRRVAKKTPHAS